MGSWVPELESQDGDKIKFHFYCSNHDNKMYGPVSLSINEEIDIAFDDTDVLFEILKQAVFEQFAFARAEKFGFSNYIGMEDVILSLWEEDGEIKTLIHLKEDAKEMYKCRHMWKSIGNAHKGGVYICRNCNAVRASIINDEGKTENKVIENKWLI